MSNSELCHNLIVSGNTSFWVKTHYRWCVYGCITRAPHTSYIVHGDGPWRAVGGGMLFQWVCWLTSNRVDQARHSCVNIGPGQAEAWPSAIGVFCTPWHQGVWPAALTVGLTTPQLSPFCPIAITAAPPPCLTLLKRRAPQSHHTKSSLK